MRLLNIKTMLNVPKQCYKCICAINGRGTTLRQSTLMILQNNKKKIVKKLGLGYRKIDCLLNRCMLYYKDDEEMTQCKFCHSPQYTERRKKRKNLKVVPIRQLQYFPLTPHLQRFYSSIATTKKMQWHYENSQLPGLLSHPSDGEAWKHFD